MCVKTIAVRPASDCRTFFLTTRQHKKKDEPMRHMVLAFGMMFAVAQAWGSTRPVLRAGKPVAGEYLIRLRQDVPGPLAAGFNLVRAHGGVPLDYLADIRTVFAKMSDTQAVALNLEPAILSVEENA